MEKAIDPFDSGVTPESIQGLKETPPSKELAPALTVPLEPKIGQYTGTPVSHFRSGGRGHRGN
ncbi:MAG: hypothetical protein WC813_04680 [Patescibacteria group bacterium]|jgi:hypothetical protein